MFKPIQISIPNPCSENWDEMTPSGQGKFCDNCQKTVVDFTGWTDSALYEFLTQNKATRICGRVRFDQIDRIIIPHQPQSKLYRLFIGLGLTLVLSQLPTTQTFARTPYSYEFASFLANDDDKNDSRDSVIVSGTVVDEHNKPMSYAMLDVYKGKQIIASAIADTFGVFSIPIHSNINLNSCYLEVGSLGYTTKKITLSKHNKRFTIQLKPQKELMLKGDIAISIDK
jgi:hypothetical protein